MLITYGEQPMCTWCPIFSKFVFLSSDFLKVWDGFSKVKVKLSRYTPWRHMGEEEV
jgi:hypothetical protein